MSHNPELFERLGEHAGKTFGLWPTDLPFGFVLSTSARRPGVAVVRTPPRAGLDATIRGPLRSLVGMAEGALDGDALFFSRVIVVEGDMEAVLALRNALDDAGLDLVRAFARQLGPFEGPGETLLRAAIDLGSRAARALDGGRSAGRAGESREWN